MARPKAKAPARRYHISGQSVVTIAGRDFYLGPHDSPESIARYAVLIGIYQANGQSLPDGFELADVEARSVDHASLCGAMDKPSEKNPAPPDLRSFVLLSPGCVNLRSVIEPDFSG